MTTKHIEKNLKKKTKKKEKKRKIDIIKNDFDREYLNQFDVIDKRTKAIDKELERIKI